MQIKVWPANQSILHYCILFTQLILLPGIEVRIIHASTLIPCIRCQWLSVYTPKHMYISQIHGEELEIPKSDYSTWIPPSRVEKSWRAFTSLLTKEGKANAVLWICQAYENGEYYDHTTNSSCIKIFSCIHFQFMHSRKM